MRIDNFGRPQFEPSSKSVKRPTPSSKTSDATSQQAASTQAAGQAADSQTRSAKIEQLKQMFATGKPIDVNQLADKLVESGIFFDKKA